MTSIVAPIYKSIVRHISDLIEEINSTPGLPAVLYQDWESRADEAKLPRQTLLGLDGFAFEENRGRWLISCGLGLSSYRDSNLLHEIELIDFIQQRMGENSKIPLREMILGEEVSELIITTWNLLPMAQSELRNYRTMGMEIRRTGA